jgi:sporulation protein YlmC with PRC-barrel domain
MELERPTAFSELIGRRVIDSSGRSLGHVFEVSAHWGRDGSVVFDEILLGRRALLRRLRGPAQPCRGIPWEAVVEVGEQIVVRDSGWRRLR